MKKNTTLLLLAVLCIVGNRVTVTSLYCDDLADQFGRNEQFSEQRETLRKERNQWHVLAQHFGIIKARGGTAQKFVSWLRPKQIVPGLIRYFGPSLALLGGTLPLVWLYYTNKDADLPKDPQKLASLLGVPVGALGFGALLARYLYTHPYMLGGKPSDKRTSLERFLFIWPSMRKRVPESLRPVFERLYQSYSSWGGASAAYYQPVTIGLEAIIAERLEALDKQIHAIDTQLRRR